MIIQKTSGRTNEMADVQGDIQRQIGLVYSCLTDANEARELSDEVGRFYGSCRFCPLIGRLIYFNSGVERKVYIRLQREAAERAVNEFGGNEMAALNWLSAHMDDWRDFWGRTHVVLG